MKRARQSQRTTTRRRDASTERLIRTLAAACDLPAEALEVLYWSREPGLVDIIRGIAAMPEDTRAALEAFIALARDAKSVVGSLDQRGVLTLAVARSHADYRAGAICSGERRGRCAAPAELTLCSPQI